MTRLKDPTELKRHAASLERLACWSLVPHAGSLYWTPEVFQLLELNPREHSASIDTYLSLCHPADRERVADSATSLLDTQCETLHVCHRLLLPSNRVIHVELRAARIEPDTESADVCYVGHLRDRSDLVRREQISQVREQVLEYSSSLELPDLLRKLVDLVCEETESELGFCHLLDQDGHTITTQAWSTRTRDLCPCRESGGGHADLDQAGLWAECARQRRPLIHDDDDFHPDKRGLPSGHARLKRGLVLPVIRDDRVQSIFGVGNKPRCYTEDDLHLAQELVETAWEIVERKRLRDLRQTYVMEFEHARRERSLGCMAAAVAHHYNNLMTVVQGNLELLDTDPGLSPATRNFVCNARQGAERASSLGKQMLAYLGMNGGERRPVDMARLLGRHLEKLKANVDLGPVPELRVPSTPLMVEANPDQLVSMLDHLLQNAREAAGEDGRILVELAPAAVPTLEGLCHAPASWHPPGKTHVCLLVADSGPGIPESIRDSIFDPFYSTAEMGRGLGLALVLGIVRAHGGGITVEPGEDGGAVFRVYLPAVRERQAAPGKSTVHNRKESG